MNSVTSIKTNPVWYICASALLSGVPAGAQDESSLVVIDAIVVTAQKREESLQEIPFAVSAVSGEVIKNSNALLLEDIARMVPGFVMTEYNPTQPQFFIRGVGSTGTSAGEDTSVGVFVDEVYAGRAGVQSGELLDLERIEVLRGPQGTLYGRNVAGGAINIISKKPGPEAEGFIEATYGRFDRVDIRGAFGGPIAGDAVMARLALDYDTRDGYITNTVTGSDNLREYENFTARGHLLFNLGYNAQLLLSTDYFNGDSVGLASREALPTTVPVKGGGIIDLPTPSSSIRTTELGADGDAQREFYGTSARLDIEFDIGTFTSITAFRTSDYNTYEDISGVGIIFLGQDENADQVSQEFRFTSTDSVLEWTAGVYFLGEQIDRLDISALGADFPDRAVYSQNADTRSYAVFGQATYPLVEKLDLTLGGRYTIDEKDFELDASGVSTAVGNVLPEGPFAVETDDSFNEFTGKVTLAYHITSDALAYLAYSRGYKSGGFNGVATTARDALSGFEPETADNYEIGLRSEWLENRLRLNLAAFYTDFQDLQVLQPRQGTQFISNAASAGIKGFELELLAIPADGLMLSLSYGYLDSEYDEFNAAETILDPNVPDVTMADLSGNELTRSPANTYSAAAQYALRLGAAGELLLRADFSHQDELFITPENRPLDTLEAYDLLGASVTYQSTDNFSISLFGKNLTDEEYKLHTFDADPFVRNNIESAVFGDPRTWGVSFSYNY